MEKTASTYGKQQRIYSINSRGQPKKGVFTDWELGEGLTTPHRKKKKSLLRNVTRGLGTEAGLCKDGNEPLGSIKVRKFID
jgi:hypothetical protein